MFLAKFLLLTSVTLEIVKAGERKRAHSLILARNYSLATEPSRQIEDALLRKYDRRHRPVLQESTTTNARVVLFINHVEDVVSAARAECARIIAQDFSNENEQSLLLHGSIWASWIDNYMTWDPSERVKC